MRRPVKVKSSPVRVLLRKVSATAATASRRTYPAWIVADEGVVAFPAALVTPRVRDALVLRQVNRKKSAKAKGSTGGHAAR